MNTLVFTLGVLSVIITAFVVVLVWGIVRVVKQEKQIKQLQIELDKTNENMYRSNDSTRAELHRRIEDIGYHADLQMKKYIDESKSYTDSRLDKFIEKTGKKLIKG